jgi:hypothetical protein
MSLIMDSFNLAIDRASSGNPDCKVTVEDSLDCTKWVQLSWDSINAAYPFTNPPLEILNSFSIAIPEFVEISEWSPNRFVTFEHSAEPLEDLARFVEQYFARILISPGERLFAKLEA